MLVLVLQEAAAVRLRPEVDDGPAVPTAVLLIGEAGGVLLVHAAPAGDHFLEPWQRVYLVYRYKQITNDIDQIG